MGEGGEVPVEVAELSKIPMKEEPRGVEQREVLDDIAKGMQEREESFLQIFSEKDHDKGVLLDRRYESVDAHIEVVAEDVKSFAEDRGIIITEIPQELEGITFSEDVEGQTEKMAEQLVEKFFNNEQASRNPEKYRIVLAQTKEYISLLHQAQEEGSIPKDISSVEIYQLVSENIALIAIQDRVASENLLGDHGVRHLLGHNVKVSMEVADCLEERGAPISAMDRLLLHQVNIVHDLGYSMRPVRDALNQNGIRGQDAGHNVLAAQYVRERASDSTDVWQRVFGGDKQNLEILHRAVLYHDRNAEGNPGIEFVTKPKEGVDPKTVRQANIESIMRLADNTHAFETKLPEVLYRYPETIKAMRLLKTAGEIGDTEEFLKIRRELVSEIMKNEQMSQDDKDALRMAVFGQDENDGNNPDKGIQGNAYSFNIDRICGKDPEFSMEDDATLTISVQESELHRETAQLFGREEYAQFRKFVRDLQGVNNEDVDLSSDEVRAGNLVIKLRKDEDGNGEMTEYQRKLQEVREADPALIVFSNKDTPLSNRQLVLEELLKKVGKGKITEEEFNGAVGVLIPEGELGGDARRRVQTKIEELKKERRILFSDYRKKGI